ncbi:MAG: ABC transporter permease, partial [Acholeplasmataceae bacterium]
MGTLITSVVLYVPSVIFSESTYSYLGIINYSKVTSVGKILSAGQAVMKESFYMVLFPSIFISLLMLSFNLFGNGLRDAFNPSLRGVEE